MEKTSPKVTVIIKNNTASACFITALGEIENYSIKDSDKSEDLVEVFCKKHCYGIFIKQFLIAELRKQMKAFGLNRENIVKNPLLVGKTVKKKDFQDNYPRVKAENTVRNVGYAEIYKKKSHRRAISDGNSCLRFVKPLRDVENIQKTVIRVKDNRNRSFTPSENSMRKNGSSENLKKDKGKEDEMGNLMDFMLKLQERVKATDVFCSPVKHFSSEQSETIKNRLIYLRCKEIFHQLRLNEQKCLTREFVSGIILDPCKAKILQQLLEEFHKLDICPAFEKLFATNSCLKK
ncbi:hypothetical protein SteCoe_37481 [Stentor coeruleus]|uniref:Uncharacterized protein n=1 Tax=Stentor coeruleus TaxID=5963 RepID=A0A1R2AMW9_9CILI|nr:hypothetical protein SteCoe_37481 [Stentor coeruleus]